MPTPVSAVKARTKRESPHATRTRGCVAFLSNAELKLFQGVQSPHVCDIVSTGRKIVLNLREFRLVHRVVATVAPVSSLEHRRFKRSGLLVDLCKSEEGE